MNNLNNEDNCLSLAQGVIPFTFSNLHEHSCSKFNKLRQGPVDYGDKASCRFIPIIILIHYLCGEPKPFIWMPKNA